MTINAMTTPTFQRAAPATLLCTALLLGSLFVVSAATAEPPPMAPMTPVPTLDLERYVGTWVEVARLPNRFQRDGSSPRTALFDLR